MPETSLTCYRVLTTQIQQKLSGTYSEMPFAHQDKNNVIGLFSATYRLPFTP